MHQMSVYLDLNCDCKSSVPLDGVWVVKHLISLGWVLCRVKVITATIHAIAWSLNDLHDVNKLSSSDSWNLQTLFVGRNRIHVYT